MLDFPQSAKLSKPEDFRRVFDSPAFKLSNAAFLLLAQQSKTSRSRLGIVVAKKQIKHAARRNRIKRLVREQFRLNQLRPSLDLIVLARSLADDMDNSQVRNDLATLWTKLQLEVSSG